MPRFLASNSLVILSLIAIKNRLWRGHVPVGESRGTGGPCSPIRHFVPGPVVGSRLPCIFLVLQHFATKLCNFTNFNMLFLAMDVVRACKILKKVVALGTGNTHNLVARGHFSLAHIKLDKN